MQIYEDCLSDVTSKLMLIEILRSKHKANYKLNIESWNNLPTIILINVT